MFVGAMCAVGTLNMNPYGFPALNAKILMFFLAVMWLAINHVDSRARDYPLVRIKYALLLLLTPLLLASGRRSGAFVAIGAALGFVSAIAGTLSFISLYVYEHPHHHCPFCLLKPEYGYQGYLFYLPLFVATAAGLAAGALQLFARIASLRAIVPAFSRRLAAITSIGFLVATAVATAMILRSNLILIGL